MSASGIIETYGIKSAKAACFGTVLVVGSVGAIYHYSKVKQQKILAQELKKKEFLLIEKTLADLKDQDDTELNNILSMVAEELINAAKSGDIDPVDILNAYLYKACSDTKKFNSVTGVIPGARVLAKSLSENRADFFNSKLYALPVSLKECIMTKGMDSTIGYTSLIGKPALDDSVIVKVLKSCGAVPFVKTNLVQSMQSFESGNPIFGVTGNPHNVDFTPGGSSIGEGSLIGSGGSPLGFGTDIGGSIRAPAHLSGCCGLKPTKGRLSNLGLQGSLPGQSCLFASIGPMAPNVDTLVLAMRALACPLMFELDQNLPPLPFNEEDFQSKMPLRIGYYMTDGYLEAVPSVQRAVRMTKEMLEKAGHVLVPFKVPRIEDAMKIYTSAFFADGGKHTLKSLKYSPVDPLLRNHYYRLACPTFLRRIQSFVIGFMSKRIADDLALHGGGDGSVHRYWNLQHEAACYRTEFFAHWREMKLDAVICPPFPIAAGPIGCVDHISALVSYTGLYNLLNCPGGVVPVTKVTHSDTEQLKDYKGHYGDNWDRHIKKANLKSTGMPVGVQVVGLPWKDEICLRLMKEIESGLQVQA